MIYVAVQKFRYFSDGGRWVTTRYCKNKDAALEALNIWRRPGFKYRIRRVRKPARGEH